MTTVGSDFMAEGAPDQQEVVEEVGAAGERPEAWYSVIWSSKKARVGVIIVAVYVLVAIFAPLIAPYSPTDGSFVPLDPPSRAHPLGTNVGGQDILSQLIYGTRVSLLVGLLGGTLATAIALVIGMISGYAEGTIVDDILSFFTSVALVIPVLPLIITLVAYSEVRGIGLIVGVIAITSWAGAARGKRAQVITLRHRDFITAAKFSGEGPLADHLRRDHAQHDLAGRCRLRRCGHRRDLAPRRAWPSSVWAAATQCRGGRSSIRPTPPVPSPRGCSPGCSCRVWCSPS